MHFHSLYGVVFAQRSQLVHEWRRHRVFDDHLLDVLVVLLYCVLSGLTRESSSRVSTSGTEYPKRFGAGCCFE